MVLSNLAALSSGAVMLSKPAIVKVPLLSGFNVSLNVLFEKMQQKPVKKKRTIYVFIYLFVLFIALLYFFQAVWIALFSEAEDTVL